MLVWAGLSKCKKEADHFVLDWFVIVSMNDAKEVWVGTTINWFSGFELKIIIF